MIGTVASDCYLKHREVTDLQEFKATSPLLCLIGKPDCCFTTNHWMIHVMPQCLLVLIHAVNFDVISCVCVCNVARCLWCF